MGSQIWGDERRRVALGDASPGAADWRMEDALRTTARSEKSGGTGESDTGDAGGRWYRYGMRGRLSPMPPDPRHYVAETHYHSVLAVEAPWMCPLKKRWGAHRDLMVAPID